MTKIKLGAMYVVFAGIMLGMILTALDMYKPDKGDILAIYCLALYGLLSLIEVVKEGETE